MDALPTFTFTTAAHAILDAAESEAQSVDADCIRTEHLVLALLAARESEPARLLARGEITMEAIRTTITNIRAHEGPGPDTLPGSELPLSAELRSVLIRAHRGTEFQMLDAVSDVALLAGLLFEGCSTGMFCLRLHGDVDALRERFRRFVVPLKVATPLLNFPTEHAYGADPVVRRPVGTQMVSQPRRPVHFGRRAEQALAKAVDAAREFNAEWVGTAYLLCGIAACRGSIAHAVLESVGFQSKNARAVIVEFTPADSRTMDNVGEPQITTELSTALAVAANLAGEEQSESITTEHLLLAILAVRDNNANLLLRRMQIDAEEISDVLQRALDG